MSTESRAAFHSWWCDTSPLVLYNTTDIIRQAVLEIYKYDHLSISGCNLYSIIYFYKGSTDLNQEPGMQIN